MKEINLFYDSGLKEEVLDNLVFEQVEAGIVSKKSVWVRNNLKFPINISVSVNDDQDVVLTKGVSKIDASSVGVLVLEFNPKMTRLVPINAKMSIGINYVVK